MAGELHWGKGQDMDVFIARQPIFDRQRQLFAYEILYRSSMDNLYPAEVDGDEATHTVLAHVLFNIGLDTITGNRRALINFTANHLLQKTPTQLPRNRCIIEVLESILPTPAIMEVCSELKQMGYILALDDFDFNDQSEQLIPYVNIVKVDVQAVDREELAGHMRRMHRYPEVLWLAEKIETYEDFQQAQDLGFTYFQGFFFNKPEVLRNRTIDSSKIILLNLLSEVCRPAINLKKIEGLVAPDVSLSYKLFRYINSVYFSLVRKVTSVRYALTYLGEAGTRQFISLAAASEIASGKPSELMRLSMVRAQLCLLLADARPGGIDKSQIFLLGLFSLLDAMLDMPMSELTGKLPLTDELKQALNLRQGPLAPYLLSVLAYEQGNFQECAAVLRTIGIPPEVMIGAYIQAVSWADQFDANLA